MKKFFPIFLIILTLLAGCKSSEKLLRKGQYEEATLIAVKKLQRNPDNERQAEILRRAYPMAISRINQRIMFLKKEGQPQNWDEIYNLYLKLQNLQDQVETVTPITVRGQTISFDHKDYSSLIIEAKNKAAEYHYAKAKQLMKQNNKYAFREAYKHLEKAKFYNPSFLDIDNLMQQCLEKGTTYILLVPINKTIYRIPQDFLFNLVDLPLARLNSRWIIYHNNDVRKGNYDLIVYVVLKVAEISSDMQKIENFTEKRKVQVGYYLTKDSTGKEIKIPKYDTVTCKVKKIIQRKIAHIHGELQYVDNRSKQTVKVVPIAADHVYENAYAMFIGDERACSDQTKQLLQNEPAPYPSNIDMILGAAETLKNVIWQALYSNRRSIANLY